MVNIFAFDKGVLQFTIIFFDNVYRNFFNDYAQFKELVLYNEIIILITLIHMLGVLRLREILQIIIFTFNKKINFQIVKIT